MVIASAEAAHTFAPEKLLAANVSLAQRSTVKLKSARRMILDYFYRSNALLCAAEAGSTWDFYQ